MKNGPIEMSVADLEPIFMKNQPFLLILRGVDPPWIKEWRALVYRRVPEAMPGDFQDGKGNYT